MNVSANSKSVLSIQTKLILAVAAILTTILLITFFFLIDINDGAKTGVRLETEVVLPWVVALVGLALFQFWALPQLALKALIGFLPGLAAITVAFFIHALVDSFVDIACLGLAIPLLGAISGYAFIYILLDTHFNTTAIQETSREIRAISVMWVVLTGFAFVCLGFSDKAHFKEFSYLGAVSVVMAALFVHTLFPRIFAGLNPPLLVRSPLDVVCARLGSLSRRGVITGILFSITLLICFLHELIWNPREIALNFGLIVFAALGLAGLLYFFFLDWKPALVAITPTVLALINLLGLMGLMDGLGNPYLSELLIIFMGASVGSALFVMRAFQRYGGDAHPAFKLTRLAIVMGSLMAIGTGAVLGLSRYPVLPFAGLILSVGAMFNLIGVFVFLPALLNKLFHPMPRGRRSEPYNQRVLQRYRHLEAHPRLFASFKLRCDNMFDELPALLKPFPSNIRKIIDIGCGYGVPAAWMIERYPQATVYGIDPDRIRVRAASLALQKAGVIRANQAPAVPSVNPRADLVLMFDMIHFLTDAELEQTLERLRPVMRSNGRLIIRMVVRPRQRPSKTWRMENWKHRLYKTAPHYRTVEYIQNQMAGAGLRLEKTTPSGSVGESIWLIAKPVL